MAEIESTYGTNPTMVGSTDGFLLFDNANPVAIDTNTIQINPLQESMAPVKNLIGRQLSRWSGKVMLAGSGTAGTAPLWNDLLRACGCDEAVDAGSSVVYTPRPSASGFESATIVTELDGIEYEVNGTYGTFTMAGSAAEGVDVTFDMQGVYNAPVNSAQFTGWAGGANNAVTMKSANLQIDNGTVTWTNASPAGNELVFKSFSFTRGLATGERGDANAATGNAGLNVESTAPKLELVIEAKNTLTALPNIWADLTASTTHAVTWQQGSVAGNIVSFSFPEAQVEDVQPGDGDGGTRIWTVTYNVQHSTPDSEFSITFS